jgi:hypothetical protein
MTELRYGHLRTQASPAALAVARRQVARLPPEERARVMENVARALRDEDEPDEEQTFADLVLWTALRELAS